MNAPNDTVFAAVAELIRTSSDRLLPDDVISADTTLLGDLGLSSVELVGLAYRLQAQFGDVVNLSLFLATMETDGAMDVRVGQLADFIVAGR